MTRLSFVAIAAAFFVSTTPAFAISAIDMPSLTFPPTPVETSKDCNQPASLTADCPTTAAGN